jgi:hypothetical protein
MAIVYDPFVQHVAGAYEMTFELGAEFNAGNPANQIGKVLDGFDLRFVPLWQNLTTDGMGDADVDLLGRGFNLFIDFTTIEFNEWEESTIFLNQYQNNAGFMPNDGGQGVGKSARANSAGEIILTPIPNSGNADEVIAGARTKGITWTIFSAVVQDEIRLPLNTFNRELAITMQAFPVAISPQSGANITGKYFSTEQST